MKGYNNGTADMLLHAFANIYQTKVIVTHAGTDTLYAIGDKSCNTLVKMRTITTFYKSIKNKKLQIQISMTIIRDVISEKCSVIDVES